MISTKRSILLWLLLAPMACDGITAPEPCRTILPALTIYVGEEDRVTPCFLGEEALIYSVESSDPEVASAEFDGDRVTITAVSPGETTVTITAANSEASGEQTFDVTVPNRAPEITDEAAGLVVPVRLPTENQAWRAVAPAFTEPDGQVLTYEARSRDAGVALASMEGDTLVIDGVSPGTTIVDLTASDGEEDVTVNVSVDVLLPSVVYINDFGGELGEEWVRQPTQTGSADGFRVRDGVLETWGSGYWYGGVVLRTGWARADYYDIAARMRTLSDSTAVSISVQTTPGHKWFQIDVLTYSSFFATSRPDLDFLTSICCDGDGAPVKQVEGTYGYETQEWVDVRLWYAAGQYHVQLNDSDPISFGDRSNTTPEMGVVILAARHRISRHDGPEFAAQLDNLLIRGIRPAAQRSER